MGTKAEANDALVDEDYELALDLYDKVFARLAYESIKTP